MDSPATEEFFRRPSGNQPLSNTIRTDADKALLRDEVTERLKWSLLDPPSKIEIIDLNEAGEPYWRPLLEDPKHVLAGVAATEPPRSRMLVVLDMVDSWEYWQDACAYDDRPAPLLIENVDGQPISVEQFVTEIHKYTVSLRDLLYEAEGRDESEKQHARYYYLLTMGPTRKNAGDANAEFRIHHQSDCLNSDEDFEKYSAWIARRFVDRQHLSLESLTL
jgi:hypothetical protein